mmetsp:Transcript_22155/g.54487  ORF Transcript_22155/g.54487 Transcript_22155/m.54487 type:complete len:92 (+) Transcript_22155:73-348(+)
MSRGDRGADDDWEPTWTLIDSIREAIYRSDAHGVLKALAGLLPEQAEKALTTGNWVWGSAIHYAAGMHSHHCTHDAGGSCLCALLRILFGC